jgi:hypothetical protein
VVFTLMDFFFLVSQWGSWLEWLTAIATIVRRRRHHCRTSIFFYVHHFFLNPLFHRTHRGVALGDGR